MRGERGGRADRNVEGTNYRVARLKAERGSARLAVRSSPRSAFGGGSNRAPSPRNSKTRKTRSASRECRWRSGTGRSMAGANTRAREREKYSVMREHHAWVPVVEIYRGGGTYRCDVHEPAQPLVALGEVGIPESRLVRVLLERHLKSALLVLPVAVAAAVTAPLRVPLTAAGLAVHVSLGAPAGVPAERGLAARSTHGARSRTIEGKAETEFVRHRRHRASRSPRRSLARLDSERASRATRVPCKRGAF